MKEIADYLYRAQQRGEIRFLLIGGRGLAAHGYTRDTKDVDFLIAHGDITATSLLLQKAGFVCSRENNICARWHHPSLLHEEVDLMFVAPEVFEKLAATTVSLQVGSALLQVPSVRNLIALKLHAIRNNPDRLFKDGGDIAHLRRLHPDAVSDQEFKALCDQFATDDIHAKLTILMS